jgi:antibiotic biosynthesis monooxygenase (ABM) superfamily enzyme
LLAIYGLQLLVNVCLDGLTASWPWPLRLGVFGGIVTASMTWIAMPCLARLLEPWLYAPPR